MLLKHIDLTTALRPSYLPDEVLLFVQDNIGLYEGKFKIPHHQNGQVYLTSHRICYIDNEDARKNSAAIDLKEVERYDYYAGLFKSSPKITLVPKPSKRQSTAATLVPSASPFHLPPQEPAVASTATWICPICTFSNPVPSNFDFETASDRTPLAPCLACGIKPPLALLLKASISSASKRAPQAPQPLRPQVSICSNPQSTPSDTWQELSAAQPTRKTSTATFECPRCTFANHPSLLACELCGAPLISHDVPNSLDNPIRMESPGPAVNQHPLPGIETNESIKLSFRGGGEKIFLERLKGTLIQRKWLLQNAPPVPTAAEIRSSTPTSTRPKALGIAGLEQRRLAERQNNELVIGNAFEDLEALMASAKEIVALAESFAKSSTNPESNAVANALGLVTTKDMLGSSSTSSNLYLSELSRNLAEFLTDDARGVLRKAGGIISLVDLWAIFNRARGGVELVSPLDFEKAARLWEKLHLPVRLRQFKSGVLVVQSSDRTDEKTIKTVLSWLGDLHIFPPEKETAWDWKMFGRGVTAQEVAERFSWSLGVAEEELEMCEEKGWLCREEGVEGCRWWENWIDELKAPGGGVAYGVV